MHLIWWSRKICGTTAYKLERPKLSWQLSWLNQRVTFMILEGRSSGGRGPEEEGQRQHHYCPRKAPQPRNHSTTEMRQNHPGQLGKRGRCPAVKQEAQTKCLPVNKGQSIKLPGVGPRNRDSPPVNILESSASQGWRVRLCLQSLHQLVPKASEGQKQLTFTGLADCWAGLSYLQSLHQASNWGLKTTPK